MERGWRREGRREGSLAPLRLAQEFCFSEWWGRGAWAEPGREQRGGDGGRAWPCVPWPQLASQLGHCHHQLPAQRGTAPPPRAASGMGWYRVSLVEPQPVPTPTSLASCWLMLSCVSEFPSHPAGGQLTVGEVVVRVFQTQHLSALPGDHCDPLWEVEAGAPKQPPRKSKWEASLICVKPCANK